MYIKKRLTFLLLGLKLESGVDPGSAIHQFK
jgi:hypothetical protein